MRFTIRNVREYMTICPGVVRSRKASELLTEVDVFPEIFYYF